MADSAEPRCTLDGRPVSRAAFDAFLATLTEVPHTWFCAETNTGGSTGYAGTDADGVRWINEAVSEPGANEWSIRRAPTPGDAAGPLGLGGV